jgi:hypothetical protein
MPWDDTKISSYHTFAENYVSTYKNKIDCADLAIASLVDYAAKESLPVKLKYYNGGWKWLNFDPKTDKASEFKNTAMKMLGALNVIDNTKPIALHLAKPGDLIMSKWSTTLGHTRIIYSTVLDKKTGETSVTWYQGNLPPVVPQKRQENFSSIHGVYGGTPRRWNFEQFND